MKLGDVFKAVIGVAIVGFLAKTCVTETIPSQEQKTNEVSYPERVGEALVEDVVDFFKGGARGLKNQTKKILDENDIDLDSLKGMDKDQILRILEERGVDFDGDTARYPDYLTDPNFDGEAKDPVIDPNVPATPYEPD